MLVRSRPGRPQPPDGTPGIELVGGPLCGQWMVLIDDADPPYPDGVALIATYGHYPGGGRCTTTPSPRTHACTGPATCPDRPLVVERGVLDRLVAQVVVLGSIPAVRIR
ncbi:hypothetical protein ABZ374_47405, partial [Embleya sp. NPDC005971]